MPNEKSLSFPCIKAKQPIGEFYIGAIKARDLIEITKYDFRRLVKEEGFATYLGIQRKVIPRREREIAKYVGTIDACFPTAVILAVSGFCAHYNDDTRNLTLEEYFDEENEKNNICYEEIAIVLDGQHRIAGLKAGEFEGDFEVNVSIFIDIDIADQAYIFSTVNLAQTKVNKSLVYDLFELAKKRSPQKTCHNIAVALDQNEKSPFFEKIKRLGVSTEGRFNETITQATFVKSLLRYISQDPIRDRDLYLRNKRPKLANVDDLNKLVFRNMFIQNKDLEIIDVIWNYFDAIKKRWPKAWNFSGRGLMLNKANGFRALMRLLRPLYLKLTAPGGVPSMQEFYKYLKKIDLKDDEFTTEEYKPGSSGEGKLFHLLHEKVGT